MRCVICGSLPVEQHDEIIHRVHRRAWEDFAHRSRGTNRGLALRVLAGLDDEQVNTEKVNQ